MNILHYYRDFYETGGVPTNIQELVKYQGILTRQVIILCKRGLFLSKDRVLKGRMGEIHIQSLVRDADLLHITGSMIPENLWIARAAWQAGVPYIVSPTGGTLNPLALKHGFLKRCKKRIWKPMELWMLNHALAIHCLSPQEEKMVKDFGVQTRTFVVPVGVFDLPKESLDTHFLDSKFPDTNAQRKFVYLGRLDIQQKGLDLLLQAVRHLPNKVLWNTHIFLVGPDHNGSQFHLQKTIEHFNLARFVTITGPIYGIDKFHVLASADAIIHPARWEETPRSVREAFSLGVPALLSWQTNLGWLVERYKAGVVVNLNPAEIANGLVKLTGLLENEMPRMRMRVSELVSENLNWERIAKSMLMQYKKILS